MFNYDAYSNLNFIFIGTGGTNGYVIPSIMRIIASNPLFQAHSQVTLIENDIVETKNIIRQNFTYNDVGLNKAVVLGARYGNAFNVKYNIIQEKFDSDFGYCIIKADTNELYDNRLNRNNNNNNLVLFETSYTGNRRSTVNIIIEAVDNHYARNEIKKFFVNKINANTRRPHTIWISEGNSDKDGQVVVYDNLYPDISRMIMDIWPDSFSDDKLQAEFEEINRPNCAANAVVNPQSVSINETAANVIKNIVYQILYDKYLEHDVIFFDRFNNITKHAVGAPIFDKKFDDTEKNDLIRMLQQQTGTTNYAALQAE